jgi:transcriptional regulator with XRE-family HTH domain
MIGERLRKVRLELGHTQESLAELLDTNNQQIWRYESNQTKPDGDIVAKIAKVLDISADYLLGLTDNPTPVSFSSGLTAKERTVISAWRRGEKFEAIKVIAADE